MPRLSRAVINPNPAKDRRLAVALAMGIIEREHRLVEIEARLLQIDAERAALVAEQQKLNGHLELIRPVLKVFEYATKPPYVK